MFTVTISPRFESSSVCRGMYETRAEAERRMHQLVEDELESQGADQDEIDEYLTSGDSIDTEATHYCIALILD